MDYPYDVGPYARKVTTASAEAQRWFDRGLNWCFGFHHEEAVACFEKALESDPDCAMAHWGVGYAAGPNYNFPWELMDPGGRAAALGRAYDASRAALALAGGVTAPERALIEALPARYPQREPIEDQKPWNVAFADAMRRVHLAHPADLDLRCMFVEAIMNQTPWQMWDVRAGTPMPGAGTIEARDVLESAFRDLPGAMDHPGLLHLHVHLMEMSPNPEAALVTGDRLREVSPDMGHLVHMPTHIDIQCGHYRDAMHWNQKAIVADRKFYDRAGPMNFYSGYRIHNYHFAAYGAMFLGQYAPAIAAADELIETMPEAMLRIPSPPMADFFESYVAVRQHVLIRFGKWREIIAQALPADRDLYCNTVAVMHYARGVAHAALGEVAAAGAEQALFREAAKRVPKSRQIHNVACGNCLISPSRCWPARSPIAAASTMRRSRGCARRSLWKTIFRTMSRGAGCSRCGTRSVRCCWSRDASPRPNWCIARISAWAARCPAPRFIRKMSGPCAACWIVWSGAARPPRRRSFASGWRSRRRGRTCRYRCRASAPAVRSPRNDETRSNGGPRPAGRRAKNRDGKRPADRGVQREWHVLRPAGPLPAPGCQPVARYPRRGGARRRTGPDQLSSARRIPALLPGMAGSSTFEPASPGAIPTGCRARTYPVEVAPRQGSLLQGPYVAETVPVTVEDEYVVIEL